MSIWEDIGDLAKDLLSQGKVKRVNLSEVSKSIHRPGSSPHKLGGREKPVVDDLSGVEVLPEYSFILQALEKSSRSLRLSFLCILFLFSRPLVSSFLFKSTRANLLI